MHDLAWYSRARVLLHEAARILPRARVQEAIQCNCRTQHGDNLRHPDPEAEYAYMSLKVEAPPETAPDLARDLLRVALQVDGYFVVNTPFRPGDPVLLSVAVAGPVEALEKQSGQVRE